jgi:hypothetical protein
MTTHRIADLGDVKYVEYRGKTLTYFAQLTCDQLLFLKNKLAGPNDYKDIAMASLIDDFDERDRETFRGLPDHGLLSEMLRYKSLYQVATLCDVLLAVKGA